VPKQYDPAQPACLMDFQDGQSYTRSNGDFRATIVFDNLIHKKEMPVTIGVFVHPGEVRPSESGQTSRSHRRLEYDSLGDAYGRFLLDELLPEVARDYRI
jgi:enterochelin esterase family protein